MWMQIPRGSQLLNTLFLAAAVQSLREDRLRRGKATSRFCSVKTYCECGVTLGGTDAQPGAPHLPQRGRRAPPESAMRDSFPAMQTAARGLLMVVAVAEFFTGLVGNGILVVWSVGEWVRKCKGSSYQLIVLGLAGCRFLLQCLIMVDLILFPFFQGSYWLHSLSLFWVVVSQASLWFATFLSVFYCKKIATFEHPAYLWLKQRACCLTGWCLLGSLMTNLLVGIHIGLKPYIPSPGNSSILYPLSTWHYLAILKLNVGCWLPCTLFLISSGMLMVSLYRHHRRMQVHTAGRNDARAKAHVAVLKSLFCFLILYLVYIMASPYSIKSKSSPADLTTVFFSETFMAAYPSLHSVILILGNPRVKEACQRTLRKTVCVQRS